MNCFRCISGRRGSKPTVSNSPEIVASTQQNLESGATKQQVLLQIPSCIVHLMDQGENVELSNDREFTLLTILDENISLATIIKDGDPLSYGVTFMEHYAGYLGTLDMFLKGHSCFSSSASSTSSSYPASNQNIDWKEFSPRINDYNNVLARVIAEGTGQIVKGIFKCSNAYTNKIQKGQEMTLRSAPELSNTLRYQKTNGGRDYDAQKKSAVNRSLKRFGESAGEATEDVLATAGHCVGAAWNIFKIRKIRKSQSSSPGVRNHVLEDLERLEDVFARGAYGTV
ncbi:hypothetical protein SAY87_008752 [Trapa incisa]|uniref:Senescence domain-containing protein n=1 Tax=Trapa incisa TaxID=236973 RepID=A0AAN7JU57_9MYRT|nr:hypothetical protein SAY87_008752 [Trapa incisa]